MFEGMIIARISGDINVSRTAGAAVTASLGRC